MVTMLSRIILLLLPATAFSEFTINISGGRDSKIDFSGTDINIITNDDRTAFGINDDELKDAMYVYCKARPNNVFVRSEAPDDLYKRFGYAEVKRTLIIKSAKVISYKSESTILSSKNFKNDSPKSKTIAVNIDLLENVTVNNYWTGSEHVDVKQKITYNVNIGSERKLNFTYQNSFLERINQTVPVKLGSESSTEITVKADETIVAVLLASKGTMEVEVEYEASLEGSIAAIFPLNISWAMDVNEVMNVAGGMPGKLLWKETIVIKFFADEKVFVYDLNGNQIH